MIHKTITLGPERNEEREKEAETLYFLAAAFLGAAFVGAAFLPVAADLAVREERLVNAVKCALS